jgi:hypothetical protein
MTDIAQQAGMKRITTLRVETVKAGAPDDHGQLRLMAGFEI